MVVGWIFEAVTVYNADLVTSSPRRHTGAADEASTKTTLTHRD